MKRIHFRSLLSAFAALSIGHFAHAAHGGTTTVTYSPATEIVENGASLTEQAQFTYPLSITAPSDIPAGTATSVIVTPSALSDPTTGLTQPQGYVGPGSTASPSLAYITLSSGSVVGAPGQPITVPFTSNGANTPPTTIVVNVTLNFPLGASSGAYAYYIGGTWPTTWGSTDTGATVNATVIPPPPAIQIASMTTTAITVAPFASTSNPVFQVATGQTTAPISFTYTGSTPALNILSVTGQLENSEGQVTTLSHTQQKVTVTTSQAVTLYGLNQTANPVFTVADGSGNQYQLLNTTSFGGATSLTLAFQAVAFGAVSSSANTITTVVTTGLPGTVTANNAAGPESLGETISGLNTPNVSGGATVNLLPDTYTLTLTDYNSLAPIQSASQQITFTVNPPQASLTATPAITLTVNDPNNASNIVTALSNSTAAITMMVPAGQNSVSIPYFFVGSTSGGTLLSNITSAGATFNGSMLSPVLTPSLLGLLLPSNPVEGTGTLTSIGPGSYTLIATDNNSVLGILGGSSATATVTITVLENSLPAETLTVTDPNNASNKVTAPSGGSASITLTIPSGQSTVAAPYTFTGSTSGGNTLTNITSNGITLGGNALSPTSLSIPANPSIGTGTTAGLGAGSYVMVATGSNGNGSASATVNVTVQQEAAPAVTLTVTDPNNAANTVTAPSNGSAAITLTIPAGKTSVAAPYTFVASTSGGTVLNTITSAGITLGGTALTPTSLTGLPANPATGTGKTTTLTAGSYTLVASGSNASTTISGGTAATATVNVTVQQAAAPAVTLTVTDPNNASNTVTAPSNGSAAITLTIPSGQTSVAAPYSFVASTSGGAVLNTITSAGITLGGTALTPSSLTGLPANPATGTGTTTTLTAGSYTLVASGSNASTQISGGGSATATVTVTVQQAAAPAVTLTVTDPNSASNKVTAPSNGSASITLTIPAGQTSVAAPYTFVASTSGGTVLNTITSAGITLGGTALSPTSLTTLPANPATGTGTTTTLTAGSYTLVATGSNASTTISGGTAATATVNVTVQQAAAPAVTLTVTDPNNASNTVTAPSNGSAAITLTIPAGQTSVAAPYSFTGTATGGTVLNTITSAGITLGGTALTPTSLTTLPANPATGTGTTTTLTVGTYTLISSASNGPASSGGGTATAKVTVTVQQAATPAVPAVTLTVADPNNASNKVTAPSGGSSSITLIIPAGQTSVAVPYSFTGTVSGGTSLNTITGAGITLGGAALSPSSPPTLGGSSATGSGTTASLSAGSYTLVATATNGNGNPTATVTVIVQQAAAPAITLTVTDPNNASNKVTAPSGGSASITLTIPSGQTTVAAPYSFVGTTNGTTGTVLNNITTAGATIGGTALTPTSLTTLPANPANGSGTTAGLAAGTYTMVATDSNGPASSGGGTASATVTVTVSGGTACSAPIVSTTSKFTGTSCQSQTIWFNSVVNVSGLSSQGGVLQFSNSTITFTANGKLVTLIAPSALITFSPTATQATSTYNATTNTWTTIAPVGYSGNVFLTGLSYPVPSGFSASTNTVTWSGSFLGSTQNLSLQWQTSATLLSQCSSNYNSCGVKPVDSGGICQYQNTDCAGTPENYRSYQGSSACTTGSSGSNTGSISISGLYATGLSSNGSLLAGGASDANYVVTASSMGSNYLGNAYVDPSPLAAGWVANSSKAQWITAPGGVNIGNGGGNNGLPSSGSTSRSDTYDYTLTFSMPAGANLNSVAITGTLSADDSVMVLVNGVQVTSGVPNISDYEYNATASFTLNSNNANFTQGVNTITFRVANENAPTPANASGLYIQSIGGTVTAYKTGIAVGYCASLASQAQKGSPPTVSATNPTNGGTYPFASGSSVNVPAGFTAASPTGSGNITAVSATLNGNPLTLTTTSGVGTSASATGAAVLPISQAGTYTLVYTGTNAYGSASTTVSFTAVQVQPPTVTIVAPADGSTIVIPAGNTSVAVPYSLTGGTTYATIQSVSVTLNGAAVSSAPTITGLNSSSITGSGSLTLTAGNYTLGAVDSNGVASASDQNSFTVVQAQTGAGCGQGGSSGNENLVWLQQSNCTGQYGYSNQNGCNQTVTGGSVVPITFAVYAAGGRGWSTNWNNCWINSPVANGNYNFVTDTTVVIAVYQIYSNNTSSAPTLYTYGANGPNPPYYSIGNNQYLLEFPTAAGSNHYQVEVYSGTTSLVQLGCEDIYTQGTSLPSSCGNGSSFNGTSISQGNCIWFNSCVNVTGLSSHASTLWFDTSTINFTCGRTPVSLSVPAACIKFDPNCTSATTTFNSSANCWVTDVPINYSGNVFLCGVPYQVPASFPTGISVNWSGCFRSDTGSVNAQWQWSAAVYSQCSSNWNALGVKPVASSSLCQYKNSDAAGTPENFKSYLTSGACGNGGSNWTGNYSGSASPSIGSNCWLDSNWNSNSQNNSGSGNNWNSNGW